MARNRVANGYASPRTGSRSRRTTTARTTATPATRYPVTGDWERVRTHRLPWSERPGRVPDGPGAGAAELLYRVRRRASPARLLVPDGRRPPLDFGQVNLVGPLRDQPAGPVEQEQDRRALRLPLGLPDLGLVGQEDVAERGPV